VDRIEAKWLLLRTLAEFRRWPYNRRRAVVGESQHLEVTSRSGTEYQIEVDFMWDDQPEGDIRILTSIDDGGWRAICPLTYSDVISPRA
jgi:hypothetical protein